MQVFIIGLLWILWILTWMAVAIAGDPGPHKLHGPLLFIYRLVLFGSMFLLVTVTPWPGFDVQYRFWDRAPSEAFAWSMVAVAFLGFTLAWWATILRLIAHKRDELVIESGPFKYVRHPFHLGLILAAFATAGMFGRPSSLTGAVVMTVAFLVKILIDDYALREEAPAYDDYAQRVSMLLPIPKRRERETPVAHASIAPFAELAEKPPVVPEPVLETVVQTVAVEPQPVPPEPQEPMPLPELVAQPEIAELKPAVTAKPVQLSLTLDEAEEDELHAAAGLSEVTAKS